MPFFFLSSQTYNPSSPNVGLILWPHVLFNWKSQSKGDVCIYSPTCVCLYSTSPPFTVYELFVPLTKVKSSIRAQTPSLPTISRTGHEQFSPEPLNFSSLASLPSENKQAVILLILRDTEKERGDEQKDEKRRKREREKRKYMGREGKGKEIWWSGSKREPDGWQIKWWICRGDRWRRQLEGWGLVPFSK